MVAIRSYSSPNIRHSMPCCLTVNGAEFPVDEYMAETKLADIQFRRRGDLTPGGKRLDKSGLSIQVSLGDLADLGVQVREATAYLKNNRDELKKLTVYHGVDEAFLSFAIQQRDEIALFSYFPRDLVTLAGDIGLGIHLCEFRCSEDPNKGVMKGVSQERPLDKP
jgi:hypothetical protein